MLIYYIITFIIGAMFMLCAIGIMSYQKDMETQNMARFFVVAEPKKHKEIYKHENIWLFIGKPMRNENSWDDVPNKSLRILPGYAFEKFGLNVEDYVNMTFEDEPVEVFLNLED